MRPNDHATKWPRVQMTTWPNDPTTKWHATKWPVTKHSRPNARDQKTSRPNILDSSLSFFLSICGFLRRFLFVLSSFLFGSCVLVSIVRSIIRCFSHILPAFLLLLLSPILLSSYYSFVFLPLFLCTAIGCVLVWVLWLQNGQSGSGVPSILLRCVPPL
jgi:hypothetical protein